MLQNDPNKRFEFEDKPVATVLTGLLIFMMILVYSLGHGLGGSTNPHPEAWLTSNAYSLPKMTTLLDKKDFAGLSTMVFYTTFGSFHLLQMAFNMYFIFVFGRHVESKLGSGRFIILIMLGILIPFAVLQFDMARQGLDTIFVGPVFLICAFIGTYMVFPPVPKSKLGQGEQKRPKNEIYRRGGRPDPLEKYTANPWMFVLTFAIIQVLFHYWCTMPKDLWIFSPMPGFDTIAAFPCIAGGLIGYALGSMLQAQASAGLKESPMTLSAVKRYHELVDMDVTHEDALRGTARTLGLPYDKVKQWVAKNKGSMRIK